MSPGDVWLEVANGGQMLGNAVRHLCAAGSGHGICKLTSFRLRREAFLLHSQIIPSRMWLLVGTR